MPDWEIGNVRVFVLDMGGEDTHIVSRLHPFGGGTIHHSFGWEDEVTKVGGYVVGSGDLGTLQSYTTSGTTTFQLNSPYGVLGNYLVSKVAYKLTKGICQSLRTDLPQDTPVYKVDVELFEEV